MENEDNLRQKINESLYFEEQWRYEAAQDELLKLMREYAIEYADSIIGELRPYKKSEQCPVCGHRQYSCTCHDAEEKLLNSMSEENKKREGVL